MLSLPSVPVPIPASHKEKDAVGKTDSVSHALWKVGESLACRSARPRYQWEVFASRKTVLRTTVTCEMTRGSSRRAPEGMKQEARIQDCDDSEQRGTGRLFTFSAGMLFQGMSQRAVSSLERSFQRLPNI